MTSAERDCINTVVCAYFDRVTADAIRPCEFEAFAEWLLSYPRDFETPAHME